MKTNRKVLVKCVCVNTPIMSRLTSELNASMVIQLLSPAIQIPAVI